MQEASVPSPPSDSQNIATTLLFKYRHREPQGRDFEATVSEQVCRETPSFSLKGKKRKCWRPEASDS